MKITKLCQYIGGNKFLHMGVSPKWVKSKRRREKREKKRILHTVALSTRIGLIFGTKAGIRWNVHKKPPEIGCAFQTNRYLKGFGLF